MAPTKEGKKVEARNEKEIGIITHYYTHIGVCVLKVTSGTIKVGDTIHIKGKTTDLTEEIKSMQIEHRQVEKAEAGQSIGLKVSECVREHDKVYKVE